MSRYNSPYSNNHRVCPSCRRSYAPEEYEKTKSCCKEEGCHNCWLRSRPKVSGHREKERKRAAREQKWLNHWRRKVEQLDEKIMMAKEEEAKN